MKYRSSKRGQLFQTVPTQKRKKTGFDLSFTNTFTTEIGRLTPICCQEVLPGDTFKMNDIIMTRFMPMLSPVMGKITGTIRYFFVPNRLLWSKWQDFITGGSDGTLEPTKPMFDLFTVNDAGYGGDKSLLDYLGVGQCNGLESTGVMSDFMPITAYNLIWQEYYRDQNVGTDIQEALDYCINKEGEITPDDEVKTDMKLSSYGFFDVRQKCWQKDYFTSALPWAQRGPAVTIPIGNSANVSISPFAAQLGSSDAPILPFKHTPFATTDPFNVLTKGDGVTNAMPLFANVIDNSTRLDGIIGALGKAPGEGQTGLQPITGVADLSSVTGITINDLRLLARTQYWLEMNAVGGGRYVEQTLAHWDELIPDYTIQRPQYLGGGKFPVQISEVLQTAQVSSSGTTSSTAAGVGNMYGHGLGVSSKPGFKKVHFREHGWVIGLISFMPEVSYFQGLPRKFTRFDKFDYAWYELSHLGEQEIKNKELYIEHDEPEGTFGYQSRFAEYKYNNDEIHGDFRSTLLYWTLARKFNSEPKINEQFMTVSSTVVNRIFAVQDSSFDHILCMLYHDLPSTRKLPKYGQPGIHIV